MSNADRKQRDKNHGEMMDSQSKSQKIAWIAIGLAISSICIAGVSVALQYIH